MIAQVSHPSPGLQRSLPEGSLYWLGVILFVGLCIALKDQWSWIASFPQDWTPPLASWVNMLSGAIVAAIQPATRAISGVIEWPMRGLQQILQWLPWPTMAAMMVLLAHLAGGARLALLAGLTCLYVLLAGYWPQTMNTLALVLVAIPLSLVPGFLLGALAQRVPATRGVIQTLLDVMQTTPAFAYLIPLLLLFGFGPVVGLLASAIFAMPPMVRNTWLALDRVPEAVQEAGTMSGCTPLQRFWLVDVPTALPQLMVGVNQTTMAALAMVIIASIIGGFEDIGWEILSAMRVAQLGRSLASGLVIALMAVLIDRSTKGFAAIAQGRRSQAGNAVRPLFLAALAIGIGAILLRLAMPDSAFLAFGQRSLLPVEAIDQAMLAMVRDHAASITAVKNAMFYFLLLPLRVGLVNAIRPQFWGFGLSPLVILAYVALLALLAAGLARFWSWRAIPVVAAAGLILFFGVEGMPWPAFSLLVVSFAWRVGGRRAGLLTAASLAFILLTDLWRPMTLSIYLCTLAVLLALAIGGAIGVWAASSDRVSAIVRPFADALQTMPQFVFLIPAIMLFKVGDITALIGVLLYAVVPPIRYVEHGLRNVRPDVVEAARQMGATPSQLLWHVKLPLAAPVLMLGVNQTIMAALSMLAIAALVGTRDLGQQVYVALAKADAGLGLLAGLAIALLAMSTDRIIHGWTERRGAARAG